MNDLDALKACFEKYSSELACAIIEPIPANNGLLLQEKTFLLELRKLCTDFGVLLIFDEVMTGFRLAKGGAQERFGVIPDLTTLGKIIGGGMPVGAYGGKKEIMDFVSPAGPVYQAGTLSGNPIAMAAGLAMLKHLDTHPEVYTRLEAIGEELTAGITRINSSLGLDYTLNKLGSMYSLFFTSSPVTDFESAKKSDTQLFGRYFQSMLKRGVYLAPSQFESLFLSTALTDELIGKILQAHEDSMKEIH